MIWLAAQSQVYERIWNPGLEQIGISPSHDARIYFQITNTPIQNSVATTYTVFCPDSVDCQISGPLPFTFAEGPSTFEYSGTIQDRL